MTQEQILINSIKEEYLQEKNKIHTSIKSLWDQYQKMGRELSEGIYSEDNHFIFELIQNAEDTISNEKQHILRFILEDKGLLVFNNETGFSADQIKAICAFGGSTKSLDKNKGFIGEKGIGFKSVFKISDQPAIHSNGYCFHFRRYNEDGETEYIIPHWIDNRTILRYPEQFQHNTHTTLYLPFDPTKKEEKIKALSRDIVKIDPLLLLFLNRLHCIQTYEGKLLVLDTQKKESLDKNLHITTIKNKDEENRFYVFKRTVDVKETLDEVHKKDGRRHNVEQREIIIAFPFRQNSREEDRLFAFLPTSLHSGLNFIIQADFILQSGRENIAVDSEWNSWQFEQIQHFVTDSIIYEMQQHSTVRFEYLEYFDRVQISYNLLIENFYKAMIKELKTKKIIMSMDEEWYEPSKILILEANADLKKEYIKILFGEQFVQMHYNFKISETLIKSFNISKLSNDQIIEQMCIKFSSSSHKNFEEETIINFTKFIATHLIIDSRSPKYKKELFDKVQKTLPILPKYPSLSLYNYQTIYLSNEFNPQYSIEDLHNWCSDDLKYFNFLSKHYKEPKLESFMLKILEENKEDKQKRTLEFFKKHASYLQSYLLINSKERYKKLFDFLLENQIDNKDRISDIPMILTDSNQFVSGKSPQTVYFSTFSSDSSILSLHESLLQLAQKEDEVKKLFNDVFRIKEADIINIILNEYLPWFSSKASSVRSPENDQKVLHYTKEIVTHYSDFERSQKDQIIQKLKFISTNSQERYSKAETVYLNSTMSKEIHTKYSIEDYVEDISLFNFLSPEYEILFSAIENEDNTIQFIKTFKFLVDEILDKDLLKFIKQLKRDLKLEESIKAFEWIIKNDSFRDQAKTIQSEAPRLYAYSLDKVLMPIGELLFDENSKLPFPKLHPLYKEKLASLGLKYMSHYFANEYKIEPCIAYLSSEKCGSFNDAINIYKHLDRISSDSLAKRADATITRERIAKEFKQKKLIFDQDLNRYYSYDVVWNEQKSGTRLFSISKIYPTELQNFFIHKVRISDQRGIRQIVDEMKYIKSPCEEYYSLLADLNDLLTEVDLESYSKSYSGQIDETYDRGNIYINALQFLSKKEKIFFTEEPIKTSLDAHLLNDTGYDIPENAKKYLISFGDMYPIEAYANIIKEMKIEKLSEGKKVFEPEGVVKYYPIEKYRKLLSFAYDLLFSRNHKEYKKLEARQDELEKINNIEMVQIVQRIKSRIQISDTFINSEDEKFYIDRENKKIVLTEQQALTKLLAHAIGYIDDKAIKDYMVEVLDGHHLYHKYYEDENIKECKDFPLHISEILTHLDSQEDCYEYDFEEDEHESTTPNEYLIESKLPLTADELRENDIINSKIADVEAYRRNVERTEDSLISPSYIKDLDFYRESYFKESISRSNEVRNSPQYRQRRTVVQESQSVSYGEEETKSFFRQNDQYGGHCQICYDTFKTNDGQNYCERFTWTKNKRTGKKTDLFLPDNSLCLCARCHAIINNGGDFDPYFLEDLLDIQNDQELFDKCSQLEVGKIPEAFEEHRIFNDIYTLPIRLLNENRYICYTQEHLMRFYLWLTSSGNKQ